MTATAVRERPSGFAQCPHFWCIGTYGCTVEDDPDDLVLHEGRPSTVSAVLSAELDVYPFELDHADGSPYSGPLVTLTADDCRRQVVELAPMTALAFSDTLASFASKDVPIGETAMFQGSATPDQFSAATVTIRRLDDVMFEYGNGAPRYMSFGAVEVSIHAPDEAPKPDVVGLDAPTAAQFARYVRACAVEVGR